MSSRRTLLQAALALPAAAAFPSVRASGTLPERWDEVYDVIVVGGGGAGLAAAVSAAQSGAKVCLIEKMPLLGGDTLRSSGYFSAVETKRQKAAGVEDSFEKHFQQTMQAGDQRADAAVVRRMVEEAPQTVRWLQECGVVFDDGVFEIYGSVHRRCLKPLLPRGSAYIQALTRRAAELGVRVKTEHALENIWFDDGGRAVGIAAQKERDIFHFFARQGVILASGGFGADAAMVAGCAPSLAGLPTDNSPGSTGDAIKLAPRLGLAVTDLSFIECVAGNPPGRKTHARLYIPADFILVNELGERFVAEDARRIDLTGAILKQPHRRCYTVFDSQGVSRLDPISQKSLYQALVADEALSAETLEELAGFMKVPAAPFLATVADYNGRALGTGEELSGKCRRIGCTPLVKPPYWAYEVGLTVHYTPGGLVVDDKARCIDLHGKPVPGLWAAGEVTGSVHGANRLGGNGLADAFTFGRLAGAAAAKFSAVEPRSP